MVISKVSVSGVLNYGINLGTGNATVVEACTVTTAGGQGIVASTIKGSVAAGCGSTPLTAIKWLIAGEYPVLVMVFMLAAPRRTVTAKAAEREESGVG